jgi:hypothetical protein
MWLLILEAAAALAILLFLVWWTMFSGRRGGEPEGDGRGDRAAGTPETPDTPGTPGADPAHDRGRGRDGEGG